MDNEQLLCYSKQAKDGGNTVLAVVNLDPYHRQSGWILPDLALLGLESDTPYQAHDLLSDARFLWQGSRNYVDLDPKIMPAPLFVFRHKLRTERQFDYYM